MRRWKREGRGRVRAKPAHNRMARLRSSKTGVHLQIEPLEDRRLLATFAVTSLADAGPGSLRQAILDANALPGADLVDLSAIEGTISLASGDMLITDPVSIVGPGRDVLTIDAQQKSRIFHADYFHKLGSLSISGLTLANGLTKADNDGGGAIRSSQLIELTITESTIRDSSTEGRGSSGGAVFSAGHVILIDSMIDGNHTAGQDAHGGGVYSWLDNVSLVRSTVADNWTAGKSAEGGGVYGRREVIAVDSLIAGNRTLGESADGGGIAALRLTLTDSTLQGNWTEGDASSGGGSHAGGWTNALRSTIRENHTLGHSSTGGGAFTGALTMTDTTVIDNWTTGDFASGGGLQAGGDDATITGSTISGNRTQGKTSPGGGVGFNGTLTVRSSTISNNSTQGEKSSGGGMRADLVATIIDSTIAGNSTSGDYSYGGGLFGNGRFTISGSTLSDNKTSGYRGFGGGITATSVVSVDRSTISGNRTTGQDATGGGIHTIAALTVRRSTISGNSTGGFNADGGGIIAFGGLTLDQSTISGNWTEGSQAGGGGVAAGAGGATVSLSTIAFNRTMKLDSPGGGIFVFEGDLHVAGSIIAENSISIAQGSEIASDVRAEAGFHVDWSLIEQGSLFPQGDNNLIGVTAALAPLADNGGPTLTHALLPESPAVNAGDPAIADAPPYDGRGVAFARIVGGRIDLGAFERGAVSGDFNGDGRVDGSDFLAWQRGLGKSSPTPAMGDANLDQTVDAADLGILQSQFGMGAIEEESEPLPVISPLATNVGTEPPAVHAARLSTVSAELIDAAMAVAMEYADDEARPIGRSKFLPARRWLGSLLMTATMAWCADARAGVRTLADAERIIPEPMVAGALDDVALSGDHLILGASHQPNSTGGRGAAFVYELRDGGWIRTDYLNAPDGEGASRFGATVAIDGSTILVGDPEFVVETPTANIRSAGAVYVFAKSPTGWTQVDQLTAETPQVDASFGGWFTLQGTTALINEASGMGVYENVGGQWQRQTLLLPNLPAEWGAVEGFRGGLAIDGEIALIGSSQQDGVGTTDTIPAKPLINSGVVHAFQRIGGVWQPAGFLEPPDPVFRGGFGEAIDLSGSTAIISQVPGSPSSDGPYPGAAYIFENVGDDWVETAKLQPSDGFPGDGFGFQVAIDGDLAAVSALELDGGRIYLFGRQQTTWTEIGSIRSDSAVTQQKIGAVLDLVGERLAIGASFDLSASSPVGAAYVFRVPEPSTGILAIGAFIVSRRRRGFTRA